MRIFMRRYGFLLFSALIVVSGFVYWQSDLTSDPPMYYSGLGQSLATDPAQYVHHARNKVLFGEFDPFDYPRWTVYEHSLTSLVGYVVFSIAGVGLRQMGIVGLLLSLGGLVLLLLALRRFHRPWVTAAVAFCYVINVTFLTYGRLAYLENGLIFLSALTCLVYARWGHRIWGAALAGGVVALATMAGKLFGALLLPALVLAVFVTNHPYRWRRIIAAIAAFGVVCAAFIVTFYGTGIDATARYVEEQAFGLRGVPAGLRSPWLFVEHLVSYGFQNRLFYLDTDLLIMLVSGLVLLGLHRARGKRLRDLPPLTLFITCWLLCSFIGIAVLTYSPIRYALFVAPPVLLLFFIIVDSDLTRRASSGLRFDWRSLLLFGVAFWLFLFHLVASLFYFNVMNPPIREITWLTLPGAMALAFLVAWLFRRGMLKPGRPLLLTGLIAVLILSIVVNTARIRRMHVLDHHLNIAEANADLPQILGPNAVVSGPYGPVLTLNNSLRSFIHLFMVSEVDSALFDRQPVTHIAVDPSNRREAIRNYPRTQELAPIGFYWIRDVEVSLYNISQVFDNREARLYRPTLFEQAVARLHEQSYDSALVLAEAFFEAHPQSKLGGALLADLYRMSNRIDEANNLYATLAARYPTDFYYQLNYARFLQALGEFRQDPNLLYQAQLFYQRAAEANRFKTNYLRTVFEDTKRRFGGQRQQPPQDQHPGDQSPGQK